MKVLLIEDDSINRMFVTSILEELGGFKIYEAPTYDIAKSHIYSPDFFPLIISDIKLQNQSAIDLFESAKEDDCLNDVSILMMTTWPEKNIVLQAHSIGVSGFLIKPFDLDFAKSHIERVSVQIKKDLLYDHSILLGEASSLTQEEIMRMEECVNINLVDDCSIQQLREVQFIFAASGLNYLCNGVKKIILYKNRISWNKYVERKSVQDLRRHFFSCVANQFLGEK